MLVCLISQIVMSARTGEYYPSIMDIMPATILRHHGLGIHVEIFISRLTMMHNTAHSLVTFYKQLTILGISRQV